MQESRLDQQLKAYRHWKALVIETMDEYRVWTCKHRLATQQSEQRIAECQAALDSDRLTIAFVAEFSRGKTELINAIFFADYGRRLLPSTAGRTTMCPTELFYDQQTAHAYVRLLPIETRLQERSLQELKKDSACWVNYPLDLASADQVAEALGEVIQTRQVSLEQAVSLGLYDTKQHPHHTTPPESVEIPKWRHALISFPHPLLKQGLCILDTPGLNALGSEPELTLNMLPSAQAVLFVLGADTGVTRSDLEMWQNHIKGFQRSRQQGLMVVLNKIDTLWDELQDDDHYRAAIDNQCGTTAKILGIQRHAIFPVSAQKGLLAKIKGDETLLQRSALPMLESYLSEDILSTRKHIVQDTITAEVSHMLEDSIGVVSTKDKGVKTQLAELQGLSGKSREVVEHLMDKTRREQAGYIQDLNDFQSSRQKLKKQASSLRQALDPKILEQRFRQAHDRMTRNWTTIGLKGNMRQLFDEMRDTMQLVVQESEQARKLIRTIYRRFQNEHGFAVIQPKMFSVMRYRVELELLYQEAEIFRNSPVTAMTEKHYLIRHFFMAIVSRARGVFTAVRRDVDNWLKSALQPLTQQINEHRQQMERRLQDLQKISQSRDTLEARIAELTKQEQAVARQLVILRNMHNRLNDHEPLSGTDRPKPHLVTRRTATG
jgi:hypothetical protein